MTNNTQTKLIKEEAISTYSSEQALADGILVEFRKINPKWVSGIFSHATTNILKSRGYINETEEGETFNIPNLMDLLRQCQEIILKKDEDLNNLSDYFYSGKIEFPSGEKGLVFLEENEYKRFTIMLPEDR